jgi:CspA family cold shock protein
MRGSIGEIVSWSFCAYIMPADAACERNRRLRASLSFQACPAPSRLLRAGSLYFRKDPIMPTGTVKFFNTDRGYGFIANEAGGPDAFVHISAVERAGLGTLREGQKVSYELETGNNGKSSAVNLSDAS